MSAGPEWDLTSPAIALRCNSGGQFLRLVKKKHCVCCRDLAIQRDNQHSRRQREQPGVIMKTYLNCVIAPSALLSGSAAVASATRVIINLSDQRASLIQQVESHWFLPLLPASLVGQRLRATSAFSTRILTIGLGASGRSSTLTGE
jgi:hypothetical protein